MTPYQCCMYSSRASSICFVWNQARSKPLSVGCGRATLSTTIRPYSPNPNQQTKRCNKRGFLTPRQCETLWYASQGLSNSEISHCMVINLRTVENHIHIVCSWLGVAARPDIAGRVAAIRWYMWYRPEVAPKEEPFY